MKKFKKFIFGCSCILFLSISNVAFAQTGTVTGKTVRIRESADGSSNIITNAYRNDKVEILSDSGEWYKVEFEGETGYISKEFVEVKEDTSNSINTTVSNTTETANEIENAETQNSTENNNTENEVNVSEPSVPTIQKESNLKLLPNFSSRNLGVIQAGTEIEIKSEVNNWIQIVAGSNTGWVLKNNVSGYSSTVENKDSNSEENGIETPEDVSEDNSEEENTENTQNQTGYINIDTARVRETAGGKIIGNLDINDVVTILGEEGDWYKITCADFQEGYVSKSLVTIGNVSSRNLTEERIDEEELDIGVVEQEEEVATPEPEPEVAEVVPQSENGGGIVEFATSFLGSPYVSGGSSPSGFDCSGFTQYVYSEFGYSISRTSGAQASDGVEVSREELQPGDLLLFQDYGRTSIGHSAIYIGDGNFVHAANPSRGVVTDNLDSNSYYNERFVTARRIF